MNKKTLNKIIRPYIKPSTSRATAQIINTVIPYLGLIVAMYYMIYYNVPYLVVLLFSIIPALFLVRIFILFHDCTHSSFIKNKTGMKIIGTIFGILVFTPYERWKTEHRIHHRTVGNIEKRGVGDVWTLTVDEYNASSFLTKLGYRLYRNPLILFVIGPLYMFVVHERLPRKTDRKWYVLDLIINNLGILSIILFVSLTIGMKYYFMIQIPIITIAGSLGVWLFFVQHQYEEVYWEESENWNNIDAAIKGSSVYKLPWLLNWFTGNIGYHNIHHLNARIPNYRLKKAYKGHAYFQTSRTVGFFRSLRLGRLFIYDKKNHELISYRKFKRRYST